MSRKGENIHKRKDGRWEGRYKVGYKNDGSPKYRSVYAGSYLECKRKLESSKAATPKSSGSSTNILFSQAANLWLESNGIRLKGATQAKYHYIIERHILPELGGLKMAQINAIAINAFLDNKLKNGSVSGNKQLSASYVRTMAIIIEAIIKFSVAQGWCLPLKTTINKPITPRNDPITLNLNEESKLLSVLKKERSSASVGTLLALCTGMRMGEVCALKWGDLDFCNNIIHIRHTIARVYSDEEKTKQIIDTPKTPASYRDVPMPEILKTVLMSLERESMFVVTDGAGFIGTRSFDYKYKKMLKENNLPVVNFHALRHTFATRCAESGMDAKTLSRLLGHSSPNISLNIYVHPSIEIMKKQVDMIYGEKYCGQ